METSVPDEVGITAYQANIEALSKERSALIDKLRQASAPGKTFHLLEHEIQYLAAALRRDMRAEEVRADTDPQWADVHHFNSRKSKDLLEMINPNPRRFDNEGKA